MPLNNLGWFLILINNSSVQSHKKKLAFHTGQEHPLFTKVWPKEGHTECAEDPHSQKCEPQHLQKTVSWNYFSFLAKCSPHSPGWSCHGHATLVLDSLPSLGKRRSYTRSLYQDCSAWFSYFGLYVNFGFQFDGVSLYPIKNTWKSKYQKYFEIC